MGDFIKIKRAIRSLKGTEQLGGATQFSHGQCLDSLFYPLTQELRRSLLRDSEVGWVMSGIKAFQQTAFSLGYIITYWSSSTSNYFIIIKDCMVDFTLFANVCQVGPGLSSKVFHSFLRIQTFLSVVTAPSLIHLYNIFHNQ